MGRLRAASLVLAALAAGLLLAACGSGGNAELLPGTTADQITSNLDQVRESVNEGDCEEAEIAVAEVSTEVDELQQGRCEVEEGARSRALLKLSEVVNSCGAQAEAEELEANEARGSRRSRRTGSRLKPKKPKPKKKRSKSNKRLKNAKKKKKSRRRKKPKKKPNSRARRRRRIQRQSQRPRKAGRNRTSQ